MSTIKVDAIQDTSGKGFYPARAWINFNGQGTISIRDDENFSSITDNGTGSYNASYTNSRANANYCAQVSCKELSTNATTSVVALIGGLQTIANSYTTSTLGIGTFSISTPYDSVIVCATITD